MAESFGNDVKEAVKCLKQAVHALKANPELLHTPELSFFKEYLESMGGNVPEFAPKGTEKKSAGQEFKATEKQENKEDIPCAWIVDDSDEDEDPLPVDPDIVPEEEGDVFPIPDMGHPKGEVTEEDYELASSLKCEALDAFHGGRIEEATELFTRIIRTAPTPGAYAYRGMCFLRFRKPVAAIRDATMALDLNHDNGKAFKVRGLAYAMLGRWEEAAHELGQGQSIDYEESIYEEQKRVAKHLEEQHTHDRRMREKAEMRKKVQEEEKLKSQRQRSCAA